MTSVGGTERVVHSLSTLLRGTEREVFQATFDAPSAKRHFDSSTQFYPLGPIPRLPLVLRPLAYVLAAWRLRQLKKRLHIDLTISNLWGADLISVLSGGVDRKIALCHINVLGNPSNHLMVRLRPFVAAVYRRFDRVVAVSETLASELKALYLLPDERIRHIDNFVDRPDAVTKLPADGLKRFVWCGRLSPEKNVTGLLHAWSRFARCHANVQLVLLGDGPIREELMALAVSLRLRMGSSVSESEAQVVFVGNVSDPASFMLGAQALLLSSHSEGMPMVLLEALSLGLPVLAADCRAGGVRTALLGYGACNPERADIMPTPAGLLLPVPAIDIPQTLDLWFEALTQASVEGAKLILWQAGSLERARHFSSDAMLTRWLQALDFKGVN